MRKSVSCFEVNQSECTVQLQIPPGISLTSGLCQWNKFKAQLDYLNPQWTQVRLRWVAVTNPWFDASGKKLSEGRTTLQRWRQKRWKDK